MQTRKTVLFLYLFTVFQSIYAFALPAADKDTAIQNEIVKHINEYRTKHGLTLLAIDNRMVREAKQHSQDMAVHKIPFGHLYFLDRIKRLHAQIKYSGAGAENVAYNYKNAEDVVKNWLKSPGHKANIDGHYNLTGVGIARDTQGKIYFTQLFLLKGNAQAQRQKGVAFALPFIGSR